MNKAIDIHTHIGDILNLNGYIIITAKGVKKHNLFDGISMWELFGYRRFGVLNAIYPFIKPLIVYSERCRNRMATLENFQSSIRNTEIVSSVCLPIPPYLNFDDIRKVSIEDNHIIPFTGIDFDNEKNFEEKLKNDVQEGAKGLKLHPNIQQRSYTSKDFFNAIESFKTHDLPVLFHCGSSSYYPRKERHKENPNYGGDIKGAEKLVKAFPKVKFIVGHGGLFEVKKVINILSNYKNVYVDTSFQSPGYIKILIKAFGYDRVLFGSDWPFGSRKVALQSLSCACRGDRKLKEAISYENAAMLLGI